MTTPGELLRDARGRNNLDQRTLARRAGTTQAQVSRIESGRTSPGADTLARLLAAMGERLELRATAGPRGNRSTAELRRELLELTPGERLAQAIRLSRFLTGMAPREPPT